MLTNCRICNTPFSNSILHLENMPAVAQNLPDKNNLHLDKSVDLDVFMCKFCGTIQLGNESVYYYKEVIRASAVSEEMKQWRILQFTDFANRFDLKGKKVIEIGTGKGEYLSLLNDVCSYGLEYSDEAVSFCKEAGLDVYKGFVDRVDYEICDFKFDGFLMLSFLEHLPNPLETLRGIYNNLSDNSYGIVEVPNSDLIFKEGLLAEIMLDHTFYFTKDSFKTVLELSGFEVVEMSLVWHDYILSATVKKRKQLNVEALDLHEIEDYIDRFKPSRVALWGASHQSLFVMSCLRNIKNISYVIDSAKFKQGRYTPVSHIPIVPPEYINVEPVDAIIVVAGSYSEEIIKIIEDKFDRNIKLAILGGGHSLYNVRE